MFTCITIAVKIITASMAIDLSSQFIDETGMGTRKC